MTGRRLVSLPFSDHCEPLLERPRDLSRFLNAAERESRASRFRYVEIRPLYSAEANSPKWRMSANYLFHRLDLGPDLAILFRNLHYNSTQRKIRRAEREGLVYREGSSASLLDSFYPLLVVTRKRHQVPPQPRIWFQNLMESFGAALKIRLALKGNRPIAGMITIRHTDTLFYKYGGSDERFHNLGGMHLLYWNSIQDAKSLGLAALDFGRCDSDQAGLITYKNRWGAASFPLNYYRFAPNGRSSHFFDSSRTGQMRALKRLCAFSPNCLLPAYGSMLYKHVG